MNDQLPDFEPEQTTEPEAQPPKRRKPMRRKARSPKLHLVTDPPKRRKMLRKVKVKVGRRGRPPGSKSKPKHVQSPRGALEKAFGGAPSKPASFAAMMEIVRQIKALPPMDQQEIVQYLKDWL